MSLESAIPLYEEVFLYRLTTFDPIPLPCPLASPLNTHTYIKIKGIKEAFNGIIKKIISRLRTFREL